MIDKKQPATSTGGGYKPLHDEAPLRKPPVREETVRGRAARQRRERQAELTFTQEDYDRWARKRDDQQVAFELGWMQSPVTQSQDELWGSLFTSETTEEQKQTIKQCNIHLNDPVRQGEIVLLPTTMPQTPEEQSLLDKWLEEAKIASTELGKLLDEEVATLNRHFELFSHQLDERIRKDGLPTDFYAQVGTGVGATAALVEQNLKNIQNVLLEINNLYVSQVAMASRTSGMGMNYGAFVADRADLFKKLDGSFAMLSKRSVQLPIYTQIKRNLKLSTKSVIHNA
ncbi:LysM domain [Vibrio sp. B1ASS3]|nr:LysM domain [Vibrio sp. B1ASS3]CAE6934754.1 LysM domain [Vibrio sp. B1ASS3]